MELLVMACTTATLIMLIIAVVKHTQYEQKKWLERKASRTKKVKK